MTDTPEMQPAEQPKPWPFKKAVCRGCYALGTACGHCERCAIDPLNPANQPPDVVSPDESETPRLCPFCGGASEVYEHDSGSYHEPVTHYWVGCGACGGSMGGETVRRDAIDRWNRRSPGPADDRDEGSASDSRRDWRMLIAAAQWIRGSQEKGFDLGFRNARAMANAVDNLSFRLALRAAHPVDEIPAWPSGICGGCGNPMGKHDAGVGVGCPPFVAWALEWHPVDGETMGEKGAKRLAEIRARLDAATPGPWRTATNRPRGPWEDRDSVPLASDGLPVLSRNWKEACLNAYLIANAPSDLAFALDLIDRLSRSCSSESAQEPKLAITEDVTDDK